MDELEQKRFLCLILLFLCSIVCFATAADFYNRPELEQNSAQLGWAISCGVISFVLSGAYILMHKFMGDLALAIAPYISSFFVIWWAFGVGFLTGSSGNDYQYNCSNGDGSGKHSVFAETNNGYFAVWLAFISSLYFLYLSVEQIQTSLEGRDYVNGLVTVALASIIEFCAAADHGGSHGWAIACGIIGFTIAFIQMVLRSYATDISKRTAPVVAVFLVIWWAFGVGFITGGGGPFYNTCCERANGFLSAWIAFLSSIYFCFKTLIDYEKPPPVMLNEDESQGFSSSPSPGVIQQGGYSVVAGEEQP